MTGSQIKILSTVNMSPSRNEVRLLGRSTAHRTGRATLPIQERQQARHQAVEHSQSSSRWLAAITRTPMPAMAAKPENRAKRGIQSGRVVMPESVKGSRTTMNSMSNRRSTTIVEIPWAIVTRRDVADQNSPRHVAQSQGSSWVSI